MRNTEIFKQIVKLIVAYKKPKKIVIFGSRARSDFKDTSDIDIAIFDRDWNDTDINLIKDAIQEGIKTPLKIDVVNFHSLEKARLRANILKEGRVLYES